MKRLIVINELLKNNNKRGWWCLSKTHVPSLARTAGILTDSDVADRTTLEDYHCQSCSFYERSTWLKKTKDLDEDRPVIGKGRPEPCPFMKKFYVIRAPKMKRNGWFFMVSDILKLQKCESWSRSQSLYTMGTAGAYESANFPFTTLALWYLYETRS